MTQPELATTRLAGGPDAPRLLVVGPSLGTSVTALWTAAAERLGDRFEVVGWDLPGHGRSGAATEPFTVAELAGAVRRVAAGAAADRPASYAGVSLGGAVALELALEPGAFSAVASLASAAKIGEPSAWHERAALVREAGTEVMVSGSAERWFAPGFVAREPATSDRLLRSLAESDDESYALACEALAAFDLRDRLGAAVVPVLVAPGDQDVVISPEVARESTVDRTPTASLHVFTGCGHLPPAEDPEGVAATLGEFLGSGDD